MSRAIWEATRRVEDPASGRPLLLGRRRQGVVQPQVGRPCLARRRQAGLERQRPPRSRDSHAQGPPDRDALPAPLRAVRALRLRGLRVPRVWTVLLILLVGIYARL